jgi:crotonobetainyl-CoA:carnitine CoA-transferase CaiB-like acyl-CoA transferase
VRQFADWGADVIKIEQPNDNTGYADRDSSDFQNLHRNKRSLTLDLKSEEGREILYKMIESADVLVENFRPSVKKRLGIDWETIHVLNPRLVLGSISGFGQTGPYAERPGFDQVAQGMGGLMSITGMPGQGPVRVGIPIADLAAGIFCAQGILIALLDRERSGKGQWVQSSLLQAQVSMLDFQAARWLIDGVIPGQSGNDHPTATPMGVYPTNDGTINIAVTGDRMWKSFCQIINKLELYMDPKFANGKVRLENRSELNQIVCAVTSTWSSADLTEALIKAEIPCGPILSIDEVFADPQVQHLGMIGEVDHHTRGRQQILAQPISLSDTISALYRATPDAGQHTDELLSEMGLTKPQIAALREQRVI